MNARWVLPTAVWMLRDHVRSLGVTAGAIATLSGLVLFAIVNAGAGDAGREFEGVVSFAAVLLVLVASAGVVSSDRVNGVYRMLFVRPVSPLAYYLLRWAIGAVAVALTILILAVPVALVRGVVPWSWSALGLLELRYLLLGGLVFAFSTVTRRDWMPALLIHFFVTFVVSLRDRLPLHPAVNGLVDVLPPFHLLDRAGLPTGWPLVHVLAYGVALLVVGSLVISWRPLGLGGRT